MVKRMKQTFSTNWKRSVQPRKQRKYLHNLPDHLTGSQLRVHLSPALRAKHGQRAVRVRVGDKVRVLRGTFRGKEGKVERVDTKRRRVQVAKIVLQKKEGGTAPYPLQPSNLLLIELADEKRRFKRKESTTGEGKERRPKQTLKEAPLKKSPKSVNSKEESSKEGSLKEGSQKGAGSKDGSSKKSERSPKGNNSKGNNS